MNLFALVPIWVRIAVLAAVLLGAFTWGHQAGADSVRAEWDAEKVQQLAQAVEDGLQAAKESQRRIDRQMENQRASDAQLATARADRVRADAAAVRLRQQAASLAAAARSAADHPAPVADSPSAFDPARMLADVLSRIDERAGILAAYADAARIAGQQCAADYEALRPPP